MKHFVTIFILISILLLNVFAYGITGTWYNLVAAGFVLALLIYTLDKMLHDT